MTVSPTDGGTVRIDQTIPTTYPAYITLANGSTATLEAKPASGYEFVGWSESLTGQTNPTTLVMDCSKSVTAIFSRKDGFSLTIVVNGAGSVTPSTGTHSYTQGTVVRITATPNTGYKFDGWTGEVGNANSASTTVTINSAKTVIANFSQITHTLTIVLKGAGSVSPSIGDHICSEGSIVSITATPGINTRFDGWTGKVADASSTSTTVTMDSDKVVTASFSDISEITHTLTLEVKGAGSVTPSVGSHSYTEGTAINITATPDTGYRFDGWTGEVGDASSASTMVTIDSDKTVVANFSKAKLTPLLLGIIIAGSVIVVGAVIWLAARRRRTRA